MATHLARLLCTIVPREHQWKLQLYERWNDIIGDMRGRIHIVKIYETTLIVGVSHPVWAQELLLLAEFLRAKINGVLGAEKITNLRVQTHVVTERVAVPKRKYEKCIDVTLSASMTRIPRLTNAEEMRLGAVQSSELRDALIEYRDRCSAHRRS